VLTSAIVTKVTTEGAFDTAASDTSAATVLGWINESYRQMVAAAEWLRALRTIGTTVANQELYDLADDVVQVSRVAVNGNDRWKIVDVEELLDLKLSGGSGLFGAPGVVAQVYDEASLKQKLQLWPAPTTAGYSIQALCSLLPADLTTSPDTTPAIPVDLHEALADGAIGLGRLRVDERADLAQPYLEKFQAAVGMLVKRRRSRLQSGAWQASVVGRR
jgi:hypothetical protein